MAVNTSNALRRFERLCNKLINLRNEADKEAYYYRLEDGEVREAFNNLSDIINGAVSESRSALRSIQSLHAMRVRNIPRKTSVKRK